MSSFATYLIGFIILIIGLAGAAYLLAVPPMWIVVGVIILVGIGVLMATSRTKTRDPGGYPPGPGYPPGGTAGHPPSGGQYTQRGHAEGEYRGGYEGGAGSTQPPRNPPA